MKNEIDKNISAEDETQHTNLNLLKLEIKDTYQKDEKITTNFEAVNDEHVVNKASVVTKLAKAKVLYCSWKKTTMNLRIEKDIKRWF